MDLFLATCQGIGFALASGAVLGALDGALRRSVDSVVLTAVLLALAVVNAAVLFGASLEAEDHPAWPGWPPGALVAALAFAVSRDVVSAAGSRAEGASGGALGFYVIVAAVVLSVLSLVLPPVGLLALIGFVWLALARRRRAARKYEGLRVLR